MPVFNKIPPAAPVGYQDRNHSSCLLENIVPKGNPDHIRVSLAESLGSYDISEFKEYDTGENYESIHGGYDREWANVDPDVVLPLDVMRELEAEGVIGEDPSDFLHYDRNRYCVQQALRSSGRKLEKGKSRGRYGNTYIHLRNMHSMQ